VVVVVDSADCEWESWPAERGSVRWRTLLSGDRTPTDTFTLGIATLVPDGSLYEHRHEQAEAYLVLEGTGEVVVNGVAAPVRPGAAVFIPGNARHGIRNNGATELRLAYVLAADSFADVEYVF
jgi:mannose-6-phosphate isomerase-like protein (cupin superfamily)